MVKTVGIVSLSSGTIGEDFVKHELDLGIERLKNYGLKVKFMDHALKGIDYLKVSAKYCYAAHESRLHQNDRCKRFTLCLVLTVRFRSLAPWGKLFQLFI